MQRRRQSQRRIQSSAETKPQPPLVSDKTQDQPLARSYSDVLRLNTSHSTMSDRILDSRTTDSGAASDGSEDTDTTVSTMPVLSLSDLNLVESPVSMSSGVETAWTVSDVSADTFTTESAALSGMTNMSGTGRALSTLATALGEYRHLFDLAASDRPSMDGDVRRRLLRHDRAAMAHILSAVEAVRTVITDNKGCATSTRGTWKDLEGTACDTYGVLERMSPFQSVGFEQKLQSSQKGHCDISGTICNSETATLEQLAPCISALNRQLTFWHGIHPDNPRRRDFHVSLREKRRSGSAAGKEPVSSAAMWAQFRRQTA